MKGSSFHFYLPTFYDLSNPKKRRPKAPELDPQDSTMDYDEAKIPGLIAFADEGLRRYLQCGPPKAINTPQDHHKSWLAATDLGSIKWHFPTRRGFRHLRVL